MEIWFLAAVGGAVMSGVSNFFFKIAAARQCNAELFILYSSITSIATMSLVLLIWPQPVLGYGVIAVIVFISGMVSALAGSLKIYALRHIDSTIYFPLFKLIVPALAIGVGVMYFQESFTVIEWLGMLVGLLVPLMLITPAENGRQNNLMMGLVIIVVTGVLSTITAVAAKYAIELQLPVNTVLLYTVLGISLGALLLLLRKYGIFKIGTLIRTESSALLVRIAIARSVLIVGGVWAMLYAYSMGGTLSVVQTIHSMYILIPIILAIIFYNEHWNLKKAIPIVLSVGALALLG